MKPKLINLLKENQFISGEKLGKVLGVSRTAVWKQIKDLQNVGYKIKSVKNKGYMLISKPDKPIPEEILPYLDTKIIGKDIFYYKTLNSTNTKAIEKIKKNASEGTIIISEIQTKGKGRKNRMWISTEGGLWFSIVLYPKIPPQNGMMITMACSIAIADAIKDITGLKPLIKWPNDILLNKKKVCGILTELNAELDEINYAIVGIGINVNNNLSKILKNIATSLKIEFKNEISRIDFLLLILKYLDEYYDKLMSGNHNLIRDIWLSYSDIINRKIKVKDGEKILIGNVVDIDNSGSLILDIEDKKTRIVCGDITYL